MHSRRRTGWFDLRHIDPRFQDAVYLGVGAHPGSRRFIDSGPHANHGTLEPDAATGPQWEWSEELKRWATHYAGDDDRTLATVSVFSAPLTLCAWVRQDSAAGKVFFWLGDQSATWNAFYLNVNADGSIDATAVENNVFSTASSAAGALTVNTWHHVTGVFASTTSRMIYVDGSLRATNSTSSSPVDADTIAVGSHAVAGGGNAWFNGSVADQIVFPHAKSPAEIALLADPTFQFVRSRKLQFVKRGGVKSPYYYQQLMAGSY